MKSNAPQSENDAEKASRYLSSHAPILLKQAEETLRKRLQQTPKNGKLWLQLGNIHRGLGDLQAASKAFIYSEALNHEPVLSRYLITLCNQTPVKLNYPDSSFTPAPFLRRFNLLTDEELEMAWGILSEHTGKFKASRVDKNKVRKTTRDSIILSGGKFKTLRDLFKERIKPVLMGAFETFDIEPPKKLRYDVQMTSHADGEFYRTHNDSGPQHARVLSYVYYFNQQPKAFSGGELQLFDTNTELNTASTTMTTIEPVHNSLIVFPSNYYHQVCTINMPNHDRIWGRQTINGWLVDAEKQAGIDAMSKEAG